MNSAVKPRRARPRALKPSVCPTRKWCRGHSEREFHGDHIRGVTLTYPQRDRPVALYLRETPSGERSVVLATYNAGCWAYTPLDTGSLNTLAAGLAEAAAFLSGTYS